MRLLSLFSGIGAFEEALKNMNIDYELVNFCEFDEKIAKCYSLIHDVSENLNLGDITKIDIKSLSNNIDIITHGSPCQSFSIAGLQHGGDEGSGTRSSLMWNTVEIIKHCKPKYVIWENVKNVLSKNHKHNFDKYLAVLEEIGYINYWKILNSKDFGVPQDRNRIFVVSIRKDVDKNNFQMPIGKQTDKSISDIIEDTPRKLIKSSLKQYNNETFFTKQYRSNANVIKLFDGVAEGYFKSGFTLNRIFSIKGLCPTLTTKNDAVFSEINGHLTGRERFKLQGFNPDYVDLLLKNGISKGTIDKVSGNSITVNVLEEIFKNLFK